MNPFHLAPTSLVLGLLAMAGLFALCVRRARSLTRSWRAKKSADFPCDPAGWLLCAAERSFFRALQESLGTQAAVFTKIRLSDLLRPAGDASDRHRRAVFARLSRQAADFVICDRQTFRILGVIEFIEAHGSDSAGKVRGSSTEAMLAASQITLLRVRAQRSYDIAALGEEVRTAFRIDGAAGCSVAEPEMGLVLGLLKAAGAR